MDEPTADEIRLALTYAVAAIPRNPDFIDGLLDDLLELTAHV